MASAQSSPVLLLAGVHLPTSYTVQYLFTSFMLTNSRCGGGQDVARMLASDSLTHDAQFQHVACTPLSSPQAAATGCMCHMCVMLLPSTSLTATLEDHTLMPHAAIVVLLCACLSIAYA